MKSSLFLARFMFPLCARLLVPPPLAFAGGLVVAYTLLKFISEKTLSVKSLKFCSCIFSIILVFAASAEFI